MKLHWRLAQCIDGREFEECDRFHFKRQTASRRVLAMPCCEVRWCVGIFRKAVDIVLVVR
jgi:hypothetical protein